VHASNSATFQFVESKAIDQEVVAFGPIKFLTVRSGTERVCYRDGRVEIYKQGRYAFNLGTFVIGTVINTQQQTLRFAKHPVLLDGGISLLVEGLLTYQVVDVERLIHQLGERDLVRSIEDVTKAEIARIFAGLHLEQISQASQEMPGAAAMAAAAAAAGELGEEKLAAGGARAPEDEAAEALLGKAKFSAAEGETRIWICAQVMQSVRPIAESWGINVINFQLESTKLADVNYAREYEAASLAMATAKANLRATQAKNQILLSTARANATAQKIEAEGRKGAVIIDAEAFAEAARIEARGRNEAAELMPNAFARSYAIAGQQVNFARELKATSLTILPSSGVAANVLAGMPMLAAQPAAPRE
jgi:uncharacterized low-complexity protein